MGMNYSRMKTPVYVSFSSRMIVNAVNKKYVRT